MYVERFQNQIIYCNRKAVNQKITANLRSFTNANTSLVSELLTSPGDLVLFEPEILQSALKLKTEFFKAGFIILPTQL
jgi:ABC-type uncharacterized transport system fused permease/ATPase subunit